jgi:photosystem II stability/assembly factor-like uncharacterized protein
MLKSLVLLFSGAFTFVLLTVEVTSSQTISFQEMNGIYGGTVLALAQKNPDSLYAGTYGDIFRSVDHGTTWASIRPTPMSGFVTGLSINSTGTLFLSTRYGDGIYRYNGSYWVSSSPSPSNTYNCITVNESDYVFVGAERYGIYRSTNGGVDWTLVNGNSAVRTIYVAPSGYILAGTTANGILVSTDGGTTWGSRNNGLTDSTVNAFVVDRAGYLFTGSARSGLFRWNDSANTWQPFNNGILDTTILSLGVDSSGSIIAGTKSRGIFISTDHGSSWAPSNAGMSGGSINSILVSESAKLFLATFGGVFRSTDGGITWAFSSAGIRDAIYVYEIVTNATGRLFAATGSGGIFQSADTGVTWTPANLGLQSAWYSIGAAPNGTLFCDGYPGVSRSTDNGVSWRPVLTTNADVYSYTFYQNLTFAGAYGRGVFRSSNGGTNWVLLDSGLTNKSILSLAVDSAGILFAGTYDGVFRSIDSGRTWTHLNMGFANLQISSILALSDSTVLAAERQGYGIFRSSNSGNSWSPVNTGLTELRVYSLQSHGLSIIAGTSNGGVFISSDRGSSWTRTNLLPSSNSSVYSLSNHPSGYVLAGLSNGKIFRSTQPLTSVQSDKQVFSKSFSLEQSYPNPFNPVTSIRFSIPRKSDVNLKIYNMLGQEVANLISQELNAGTYTIDWNPQGLPSGVYLYRLRAGSFSSTRKLIYLR